ncbi:MAG: SMI1/KNR4 family protein [Vicinamibacteraceae bacterium]
MGVLDELEWVTRPRADDDDDAIIREPGLDAATIDAVERRVGAPLPSDLRTLLGVCHGIRGLEWEIDFAGNLSFEMDELFPHGLPIVGDHTGNFWVVDCTATPETEAAVFFACHDPPVILWQCRGMATLLQELRRKFASSERSSLDDVHDDLAMRVWRTPAATLSRGAALDGPDDTLRAFANALTDEWSIIDLRGAVPGTGFAWGRCAYPTGLRRHGEERLFACAAPKRRTGILSRLFGR